MSANRKTTLDMTGGSVVGKLLSFTIPVLASNLLQHLYNAADKAVVGKFALEPLALGAVGSTGSAITLLLNLFYGLALGANVICSNLRGASKPKELRRAMHTSIALAGVGGVAMAFVGILVAEPFLALMGSPDTLRGLAVEYMRIYFIGVPFSLLYNFGASILRSHGDTKRPMIILAVTGIVNVVLNMVFVIGLHMDVDGVAWATVISQVLSAAAVLRLLFKPDGGYDLNLRELKLHIHELAVIARVGIPCALNGLVFSISNVLVQSAVNGLGESAIDGNAAAEGITGLVYQVLAAFYTACISFSGQCYGAKRYKRIDRLVWTSILLCGSMIAVLSLIATIWPQAFLKLFTNSEEAIHFVWPKMLIISWGYILYGTSEVFLGALRGMRRSAIPTLINAVAICLPRVLWVTLVFPFFKSEIPCQADMTFLCWCYPISWIISSSAQGIYYLCVRRKLDRQNDEHPEPATV